MQAARRLYLFSLLNRYDREMVNRIDSLIVAIEQEKTALQERRFEITDLRLEKRKQSRLIRSDRKNRKNLLTQVLKH